MEGQLTRRGVLRFGYSSMWQGTLADGSGGGGAMLHCFGGVGDGTRLHKTRVTSCMVGRSDGCLMVHRRAS
uniref:Uncharacterized protein n=1 Tax=Rhizophora mucronata TaxID=61149 RepID=A0A2P2NNR9_RHIMU